MLSSQRPPPLAAGDPSNNLGADPVTATGALEDLLHKIPPVSGHKCAQMDSVSDESHTDL